MDKETEVEIVESLDLEVVDKVNSNQDLIPQMNVNVPAIAPEEGKLIPDEKLVGTYDEVMGNIRSDRSELTELIDQIKDMVLNGGDATTSTKEALVNLMKIKLDTADKMSKIADLMTRARGVNTFPRYLAVNQNNTINNETPVKSLSSAEKRALIETENKKQAKGII